MIKTPTTAEIAECLVEHPRPRRLLNVRSDHQPSGRLLMIQDAAGTYVHVEDWERGRGLPWPLLVAAVNAYTPPEVA